MSSALRTVEWTGFAVRLIDQTVLPARLEYVELTDWRDVVEAIRTMVVRGAPAIGCTAALGLALSARQIASSSSGREEFLSRLEQAAERFRRSRPTAVNLFWAVDRMMALAKSAPGDPASIAAAMEREGQKVVEEDLRVNRDLGRNGAELIESGWTILTHCNAGALCAAGYGTALGVIRAAVEAGKDVRVLADETRPRLQGMKLTAWELHQDGIPVTIVADNMAAVLMRDSKVDCVVVGADRIAANGDVANKIGTYGVAVHAHHHGIPFYVAAPLSTIDRSITDGTHIPIEERDETEMTHIDGARISPAGVPVINPAFDVTPNGLVSAIITERGVARAPYIQSIRELFET